MWLSEQKSLHAFFHSKAQMFPVTTNKAWPQLNVLTHASLSGERIGFSAGAQQHENFKHAGAEIRNWRKWKPSIPASTYGSFLVHRVSYKRHGAPRVVYRLMPSLQLFCLVLSWVNVMWYIEDLPAVPLISSLESRAKGSHHPRTLTCVDKCRAASV